MHETIRPSSGTSIIQSSLGLDRKIRAWFILIFAVLLGLYAYFGVAELQTLHRAAIRFESEIVTRDAFDRAKLAPLAAESERKLPRAVFLYSLPIFIGAGLLFFILGRLKADFRQFMVELSGRERILKSKERSKQLILESLSEGILEYDLRTKTWITISGKFLEIFWGNRYAPVPLDLLENGLRAWVNLAPEKEREALSKTLLELTRKSGSFVARVNYEIPTLGSRTIELRIFSRLRGKSRQNPYGIIAISHRDVSDEIRLEQERSTQEKLLAEYNDRMRFALDTVKLGVWEWELGTNVLNWDDRTRDMFEFFEDREPLFDDLRRRIHPEDVAHVESSALEAMRSKNTLDLRFRIKREDGTFRTIHCQGKIQFDSRANPVKVVGLNWDVTEEVNSQRELEESRARQQSSARLAAIGEMASGIAHEINNPLTVIAAKAMLLQKRLKDDERVKPDVKSIEENIFRISKIVKGLRVFSRDGENDPLQPLKIHAILDDALGFCTERFKLHKVTLDIQNELDEKKMLYCRGTQIAQIVLNLLNNAFDATEDQTERKVSIRLYEEKNFAHILVQDNGPGVPKEIEDKIMLPFFTTKEVGKGTGLGLSISHGIAQEHGGALFLDRKRGKSCFHLTIPLHRDHPDLMIKAG